TLGDEVVLEKDLDAVVADDLLDLLADTGSQGAFGPADLPESHGGAVHDAAVMVDGCRQWFKDIGKGAQRGGKRRKTGDITPRGELARNVVECAQHGDELQQILRRQEGSRRPDDLQQGANVLER